MRWLLIFFLVFSFSSFSHAQKGKVLFIIASNNFRDEELLVPKKIIEEGGYKAVIASSSLSPCKGMLGSIVKPDLLISQINISEYKAIILPGGSGAQEYWNNKTVHKLLNESFKEGKVIGAICISPVTLAVAHLLKNRRATCWWSYRFDLRKILREEGAKFVNKDVVVDGKIVTANSPKAAGKFGREILNLLKRY